MEKFIGGKKMNKAMFAVGILVMIAVAAVFLFVEEDLGVAPIVLGIFGITTIGASQYRPLEEIGNLKEVEKNG